MRELTRPNQATVEEAVRNWMQYCQLPSAGNPTWQPGEWNKDHTGFIVGRVLPVLNLPYRVHTIAVEAYLAGYEGVSDGSTVVPDSARYGRIKDWQGVMHDYIYWLHHQGLADAFGHIWSFNEANNAYRWGWICDGQRLRGDAWYLGLTLGGYPAWAGWLGNDKQEE